MTLQPCIYEKHPIAMSMTGDPTCSSGDPAFSLADFAFSLGHSTSLSEDPVFLIKDPALSSVGGRGKQIHYSTVTLFFTYWLWSECRGSNNAVPGVERVRGLA